MLIKQKRKDQNLTQQDLAELLNVKQPTIALWECGATVPTAKNLIKLAAALHCTVDELLKEDREEAI